MAYVDGFVLAVPTANKQAYREMAEKYGPMFLEFGALSFTECWGDDVPDGEVTSFPMAVKREEGETVVFSWIKWPDKATRDAGNTAVMADPRMADFDPSQSPFDSTRMIFGGFEVLVSF